MSPNSPHRRLEGLAERHQALARQLDQEQLHWWQQARDKLAQADDASTAAVLISQCKRHLRDQPLPDQAGWSSVQLARALLLAEVLERRSGMARAYLLEQLFQWGDDQEKIVLLKALDWLDRPGQCLELALLAGRTSNPQVFAALALDNPYPARHYPERAFHQLVLKALGMGLDCARVSGLAQRHGVELNQLALDLLDEQLDAARPVAASLPRLIAFGLLSAAQRQRLASLAQQQRLPAEWQPHLTTTPTN